MTISWLEHLGLETITELASNHKVTLTPPLLSFLESFGDLVEKSGRSRQHKRVSRAWSDLELTHGAVVAEVDRFKRGLSSTHRKQVEEVYVKRNVETRLPVSYLRLYKLPLLVIHVRSSYHRLKEGVSFGFATVEYCGGKVGGGVAKAIRIVKKKAVQRNWNMEVAEVMQIWLAVGGGVSLGERENCMKVKERDGRKREREEERESTERDGKKVRENGREEGRDARTEEMRGRGVHEQVVPKRGRVSEQVANGRRENGHEKGGTKDWRAERERESKHERKRKDEQGEVQVEEILATGGGNSKETVLATGGGSISQHEEVLATGGGSTSAHEEVVARGGGSIATYDEIVALNGRGGGEYGQVNTANGRSMHGYQPSVGSDGQSKSGYERDVITGGRNEERYERVLGRKRDNRHDERSMRGGWDANREEQVLATGGEEDEYVIARGGGSVHSNLEEQQRASRYEEQIVARGGGRSEMRHDLDEEIIARGGGLTRNEETSSFQKSSLCGSRHDELEFGEEKVVARGGW